MVKGRKSRATIVGKDDTPKGIDFQSPAPSRKRVGETLSVRTKKLRIEYEEIFNQFKKIHEEELSSIVLSLGTGDAGQLGLGDKFLERKRPFPIDDLTDIVKIRAGGMHNVCLTKNGKVLSFGCNDDFALGRVLVDEEDSMVPGEVIIPTTSEIIDVTAGDSHSAVLTANGKVFIWGTFRDNASIIGLLKPSERVAEPIEVHTELKIVKIASGENHFVMLTDMGEILTFGCAEQGQLGRVREVYLMKGGKSKLDMLLTAAPIRVKHNIRFNDIWAGSYCTVAKAMDGDMYGCGLNNWAQLGITKNTEDGLSTVWMTKLDKFNNLKHSWKMFVFGLHHTLALTETGSVYVIGRADYGNLGLGNREHKEDVILLSSLNGKATSIAACGHVSYALIEDGTAWSWGCGNTYQLGFGDDEDAIEPGMVQGKFLKDMKVIEVSVGGQHVLFRAVKKDETRGDVSKDKTGIVVENKTDVEMYNPIVLNTQESSEVITQSSSEVKVETSTEVKTQDPIEIVSQVVSQDNINVTLSDPIEVSSQDPIEVASQDPTEVASQDPTEVASQDPIEDASQDPIEVASQDPIEVASQDPIEVASQDPIEIASQDPIEVASQDPIEVTSQDPIEVTSQCPMDTLCEYQNAITYEDHFENKEANEVKIVGEIAVESMEIDSLEH